MKIYDIENNFKEITIDEKGKFYWIVMCPEELNKLNDIILLDKESIEECYSLSQYSQINFFSGYIFIIINLLEFYEGSIHSEEMNIFLSNEYIITVCRKEFNLVDELIKNIKEGKNCFMLKKCKTPSTVFYYILDRVIIKNYNVISALEEEIDKIEIEVLKRPEKKHLDKVISLRRQVYKVRKHLNPLRYIGDSLLTNENDILDKSSIIWFKLINEKINKLMSSVESLTVDLGMVREAFEAEISNKTNELMKIFTVIATIFLPLNLISSMLGMNVQGIPLTYHKHGYYYVTAIMIIISFILCIIFKKKKWI